MVPKNNSCPCTPDCPKRVLGCRPNCEDFQIYERNRLAGYEQHKSKDSMTRGHAQAARRKINEDHRHGK